MKKTLALILSVVLCAALFAGCSGNASSSTVPQGGASAQPSPDAKNSDVKIALIVGGKLGDNAANDACFAGIDKYSKETGIEIITVEATELQDNEINARNFASEGYNLVILTEPTCSELIAQLAPDYPETHFLIQEGTIADQQNVTCLRTHIAQAGFLTGAFNALMNKELGGASKGAFVGGVRNPNLERSQYGFTAGCEYVGGECTVVYVGNFTDVAKGKEIALNLYQNDLKLIQAFAGGAGMGVYQAAESLGDGYYALGGATGQFNLSPSILASQVKNMDTMLFNACTDFTAGKLASGIIEVGLDTGAVGIKYAPDSEGKIPQAIKDEIKALEDKIISGEIVPPATEEQYQEFAAKYPKK